MSKKSSGNNSRSSGGLLNREQIKERLWQTYGEEIEVITDPITKKERLEEFEKYVDEEYKKYVESASFKEQQASKGEYHSELQEKFVRGFDMDCIMALIPARIYYFQLLSLIFKRQNFDDRYYLLENSNGDTIKSITAVLHFFWEQQTSSGKSQGHKYYLKTADRLSKLIARNNNIPNQDDRFEIVKTKWVETQETFINRFEQVQKKGQMVYDFTKEIPGIFQEADVIASEECSFLFSENQQNKQNISELMLDALEGNAFKKTLVAWNGHKSTTKPNFIFSGLSRPTQDISRDFFNKGLLQRMLIYHKNITGLIREKVLEKLYNGKRCDDSYFDMLANEFYDLYMWKAKNNPQKLKFDSKETQEQALQKSKEELHRLKKEFSRNPSLVAGLEGLVSRYYAHTVFIIMSLAALSRRSTTITMEDFNEAHYILKHCIDSIKQFAEKSIFVNEKERQKRNLMIMHIGKMAIEKNNKFTIQEAEQVISQKMILSPVSAHEKVEELIDFNILIRDGKTNKLVMSKEYFDKAQEMNRSKTRGKTPVKRKR